MGHGGRCRLDGHGRIEAARQNFVRCSHTSLAVKPASTLGAGG